MPILKKPILIITGPSASGKATLSKAIKETYEHCQVLPSATTRQPKPEIHGKKYLHFSFQEFETRIQENQFAEYNKYPSSNRFGFNYYGTLKRTLHDFLNLRKEDELGLLDIDLNGTLQLKKFSSNFFTSFLVVNEEELRRRIDKRGSEPENEKLMRLKTGIAETELAYRLHDEKVLDVLIPYGENTDPYLTANKMVNLLL